MNVRQQLHCYPVSGQSIYVENHTPSMGDDFQKLSLTTALTGATGYTNITSTSP